MDTVTAPAPAAHDVRPLTLTDRCDRCGSRAYLRAVLPGGGELLFCGHHGNAHRPSLVVAGAQIQDETDKLTVARESGF